MLRLVIGNRNYSSWSLRAWLALRLSGLAFEEVRVPLYAPGSRQELLRWSPAGRVPVLHDDALVIWDSLAICEYVAERAPEAGLWPSDPATRAVARSACAEMHAGFHGLRERMPMNLRARARRTPDAGLQEEIERVAALWTDCRVRFGGSGEYLFGAFGLADCFYLPVATRFRTWGVELDGPARTWSESVLQHPAFLEWERAGVAEDERIAGSEPAPEEVARRARA